MTVVGAVLCGGRSRRMGRDKATMVVDGSAMASSVVAALRNGGCESVVAIGGDAAALAALGLDVVPDGHPGEGPLGGIDTALENFPSAAAVVITSCDLPWLTAATVRVVIAGLGHHDAAIAVGDRTEPLCAVWRASSADAIRASFAAGERAVHRVLAMLDVAEVVVDPGSVQNVNSPADVRRGTRGHEG